MNWLITLPAPVEWSDYEKELEAVKDRSQCMRYRIPSHLKNIPTQIRPGDRCYMVWRGRVRGWMEIVRISIVEEEWACTTTGRVWPPGAYIERSGPFHPAEGPEIKGFRGIRRFNEAPCADG